jgi:hypothetical protein
MAASEMRRPINADVVRRVVHVLVLIGLIVGVRACGGAASAEDRLGAGTQWFAEKTGLAAAKARWDKSIRPPIAAMTSSASQSLYGGLSRSLEQMSSVTDQSAAWVRDSAGRVIDAAVNGVRAMFVPGADSPQQSPDPPREAQRPAASAP